MATYTPITSGLITTNSYNITFSSIPSTYTDLLIRISTRYNDSTAGQYPYSYASFNGQTSGNNYNWWWEYGVGTTSSTLNDQFSTTPATAYQLNGYAGQSGLSLSSTYSTDEWYIPNYATSVNKGILSLTAAANNGAAPVALGSSFWLNSSAVNSITLNTNIVGASIVAGSRIDIYGITNS